jgi:choline dehydrogenase-like flavoprotein
LIKTTAVGLAVLSDTEHIMVLASSNQFDAIVVGSGISGGWAAKELTEKGLKVLVLDRGRDITPGKDYLGEHAPQWKVPYQGKRPRELYAEEYPTQSKSYAFDETTRQFWNNDKENPYQTNPDKPFEWMRADVVGGRSLLWARQSYRFSEQDFAANKTDGHGIPWPIDYKDIAPWYSYVESFAGISGQAEGLDELPDGEFLPPMEMYPLEKTVKSRLAKKAPDVTLTMGRTAVLTQDHNGRAACHYCGPCHRGCSTGSYFSSHSSTLPAARATGNMTLQANAVVERLEHDDVTGKIAAVHVIDSETRERTRYTAKIFFLCASTVGSTQILLNSTSKAHPTGLGNQGGVLGHYMMDHYMTMGGLGIFLDNSDSYYKGKRPNNLYVPRFRNVGEQDEDTDFVRGFGYQVATIRTDWSTMFNSKGFGADLKESLRKPGFWSMAFAAFGECLPYKDNHMRLDHKNLDRFGIPQAHVEFEWGENEMAIERDMHRQADRLLKAAGAVIAINPGGDGYLTKKPVGGGAIHEMGTARMGDDPSESVLNKHNQVHGVPNLFVTDGSCMTSASCVNPSLTYMALTARAADYAVKQLAAGAI